MKPTTFCFYHDQLPDERWHGFYKAAEAAIRSFAPNVRYLKLSSEAKDYLTALTYIYSDHPEYFYMNVYGCRYFFTDTEVIVYFSYDFGVEEASRRLAALNAAADRIIAECFPEGIENTSELRREKKIFDWITYNVTYDHASLEKYRKDTSVLGEAWTAYGTLVLRTAVCQGIANAFKLLCDRAGIPSLVVCGMAGERHAWNIVRIDQRFYQVDCTWALKYNMDFSAPYQRYQYLNLPDVVMKRNHTPDDDFLPQCASLRYNPFKMRGECCGNDEELYQTIRDHLVRGEKRFAIMNLHLCPEGDLLASMMKCLVQETGIHFVYWPDRIRCFIGIEVR